MSRRLTLADARGQPRTIAGPKQLQKRKLKPKQFDLPDPGESEVGGFWTAQIHGAWILSFLAAILVILASEWLRTQWPRLGYFWSMLIPFLLVIPVVRFGSRQWWTDLAPRYRDMLTLNSRCGSCALDLSNVASDPDGCTVCPECNAAWRLPANPDGGATA